MPVLTQPSLTVNENSTHLARTAPAATSGINAGPTDPQLSFLAKLLADRDVSYADRALQGLIDAHTAGTLSRGNASKLIDLLKKLPFRREIPRQAQQNIRAAETRTSEKVGPGYYRLDGDFYRVQTSRSSDRNYSLLWTGSRWDYESGRSAYSRLTAAMELSAEDAKEFGDQYHACVFCTQQLTDQRSIDAGYGPICAQNHGLPWG
jgi:hypothetical protein